MYQPLDDWDHASDCVDVGRERGTPRGRHGRDDDEGRRRGEQAFPGRHDAVVVIEARAGALCRGRLDCVIVVLVRPIGPRPVEIGGAEKRIDVLAIVMMIGGTIVGGIVVDVVSVVIGVSVVQAEVSVSNDLVVTVGRLSIVHVLGGHHGQEADGEDERRGDRATVQHSRILRQPRGPDKLTSGPTVQRGRTLASGVNEGTRPFSAFVMSAVRLLQSRSAIQKCCSCPRRRRVGKHKRLH